MILKLYSRGKGIGYEKLSRLFVIVPGESRRGYALTRLRVEASHPAMKILTRNSLERVKTYTFLGRNCEKRLKSQKSYQTQKNVFGFLCLKAFF